MESWINFGQFLIDSADEIAGSLVIEALATVAGKLMNDFQLRIQNPRYENDLPVAKMMKTHYGMMKQVCGTDGRFVDSLRLEVIQVRLVALSWKCGVRSARYAVGK